MRIINNWNEWIIDYIVLIFGDSQIPVGQTPEQVV